MKLLLIPILFLFGFAGSLSAEIKKSAAAEASNSESLFETRKVGDGEIVAKVNKRKPKKRSKSRRRVRRC